MTPTRMIGSAVLTLAVLALAALAMAPGQASAQDKYPSRPIELIVPSPPGGGTDIAARLLAELVEPYLGQKVVVINKAGGGGTLGTAVVTKANPDGYTLAAVWNSPLTAIPQTLKVPYEVNEYTPIVMVSSGAYVMCVAPDFPAASGKELIAALKAKPGEYTYGNDGVGGTMQLGAERIFQALGVKARSVPFGGAGETARNFLGGHVAIYGGSVPPIVPHVTAGKAKCLLLTSAEGNPALPQAAGLAELGIAKEETVLWRAILGPKGLAADKVEILERAFRKAAAEKRFGEFLAQQGEVVKLLGPKELRDAITAEFEALATVAKGLGLERKG